MDALVVGHEPVTGARFEAALGADVLPDVVVHDLDVVVQARQADRHVRALLARVLPRGTFFMGVRHIWRPQNLKLNAYNLSQCYEFITT